MLQMNCPKCGGVVKSPYLAELSTTHCDHCKEEVTVGDVFVSTKGFTMHRDDLLNRISRFQKLLSEVEKEIKVLEGKENVSKTTQKNITNFYATLQELLIGARSNFRLDLSNDLSVAMDYNNNNYTGRLVNISTEGASLEFEGLGERLPNKAEINLNFTLPGFDEPLSLLAKVVWAGKRFEGEKLVAVKIGARFTNPAEKIRSIVWDYIIANSPVTGS